MSTFKITSVFPLQSDWSVTGRCQGKARATEMNEVYVINLWTENCNFVPKGFLYLLRGTHCPDYRAPFPPPLYLCAP